MQDLFVVNKCVYIASLHDFSWPLEPAAQEKSALCSHDDAAVLGYARLY